LRRREGGPSGGGGGDHRSDSGWGFVRKEKKSTPQKEAERKKNERAPILKSGAFLQKKENEKNQADAKKSTQKEKGKNSN